MNTEITALLQECDALKARLQSLRPLPVEALKKMIAAIKDLLAALGIEIPTAA